MSSKKCKSTSAGQPRAQTKPDIPAAVEIEIEDQRASLGIAISLIFCLHGALRRQIEDEDPEDCDPVAHAAEWADLTDITGMLLVRLYLVHNALDSASLREAFVNPKRVKLAEAARKLKTGDDAREAS
jgi:hypothetical protein